MRKLAWVLCCALAAPAFAGEKKGTDDALATTPFREGDTITFAQIEKLKNFLPEQFWDNREYFFYQGMQLVIGPTERDVRRRPTPMSRRRRSTRARRRSARTARSSNYSSGLPFATASIDCKRDPDAGTKIIWNFNKSWNGDGANSNWSYTYWDRGEQLPLYYEGSARAIALANRVEPAVRRERR